MVNESSGAEPGRAVNAEHTRAATRVPGECLCAHIAPAGKGAAGCELAGGKPGERKARLP